MRARLSLLEDVNFYDLDKPNSKMEENLPLEYTEYRIKKAFKGFTQQEIEIAYSVLRNIMRDREGLDRSPTIILHDILHYVIRQQILPADEKAMKEHSLQEYATFMAKRDEQQQLTTVQTKASETASRPRAKKTQPTAKKANG